jgi:hypothetical protein
MNKPLIERINKCNNLSPNNPNIWLFDMVLNGEPLIKIAKEYVDKDVEFVNSYDSSSTGLFFAYIHFKNLMDFSMDERRYLSNRSGSLGTYLIPEEECGDENRCDIISVRDIIYHYENNNDFVNWLEIAHNTQI